MESKVANISLADFGNAEIALANVEMPGLMALQKMYSEKKSLKGVKIAGSLHMTIQTAVLIQTLAALGATIRWCSCNIYSTQDHAAAAIAAGNYATVFAWKGETIEEYWWCTTQIFNFPNNEGPDMIVDDGSDATLFLHEAVNAEKKYNEQNILPDTECSNADEREMKKLIKQSILQDPTKYTRMVQSIVGVSEETTTGVNRLKRMAEAKTLLFPAINVNNCVTKSKFDNIYGCRHSLIDGIYRATDVMVAGKLALIIGYGDVGKGCAQSLKGAGARVAVADIDPICCLQAAMEGYQVTTIEDVISSVDIFITATGNCDIITLDHMKQMKNNAIVGNIGHFDNEICVSDLENDPTIKEIVIKPQLSRFVFPDGKGILLLASGRLLNLGCATGHPSFVMSTSFTNQVFAQLELWENRNTNKYSANVYALPRHLDELVADLHLAPLGAKKTILTQKQADYIGVDIKGPFKSLDYRY